MGDLLRSLRLLTGGNSVHAELQRQVESQLRVPLCRAVSTGRAAMTLLLRALRRLDQRGRTVVLVPSYTCYSVPASIVKAGLTPQPVDVDPHTLDIRKEGLAHVDPDRTLALVATNLYGLPNDLPYLTGWAKDRGVFVVDDAAQAMGASIGGQCSGTFGDVGLYSLDKGKNVSAIDGGLIVSHSAAVKAALAEGPALPPASLHETSVWLAKLAAYVALLHPRLYWIPNGLPGLGLGMTAYTTEYPIHDLSRVAAALAATMLARLDDLTAQRRANGRRLAGLLEQVPGVAVIRPLPGAEPAYLRLPLLAIDGQVRDRLVTALNAAGFGATGSYPASIVDIPALTSTFGPAGVRAEAGRDVARRILTLPTHPYVTERDIVRIAETVDASSRRVRGTVVAGATAH